MNRQRIALCALALVLLTGLVYAPAFHGGFLWDDDDHLTENRAVAASDGLVKIWSSISVSRYYPLTLTTFWVEYHLWGLNPLPYHTVNILLHMLNTVLLFLLLRRLGVRGAWVAAALWGIHPVNVESVAWVTEMKNTQSTFFFLWCFLVYLRFETTQRKKWYVAALLLFAAALLSKPSTVFLPAGLLLCIWWLRGRWEKMDLIRVLPFFLFAGFMSLLTIVEQQRLVLIEASREWSFPFVQRLAVAGRALWFYAGELVWPFHVNFIYRHWSIDTHQLITWIPLIGVCLVAVLLFLIRRFSWAKPFLFGLTFFTLALGPVLGFLNIYFFRYSYVSDHFNYLGSMALLALAVAVGTYLIKWRPLQIIMAGMVLGAFGVVAWDHVHDFHDNETLWRETLLDNPDCVLACNNLGNIYQRRGDFKRAYSYLTQAVTLSPDYPQVHNNLGTLLAQMNEPGQAELEFKEAIRLRSDLINAHYNLARVLEQQEKHDEAIQELLFLINNGSSEPGVYLELQELLWQRGRHQSAITVTRAGHEVFPSDPRFTSLLAWHLAVCPQATLRQPDEAIILANELCRQTRWQDPQYLDTLAAAYAAVGWADEAADVDSQALELATAKNQTRLMEQIQSHMDCFRENRPLPPHP